MGVVGSSAFPPWQLRAGLVSVQAKNLAAMEAAWNDDARIERLIYELNFGAFSKERLV